MRGAEELLLTGFMIAVDNYAFPEIPKSVKREIGRSDR